jgi:hypothetical protein
MERIDDHGMSWVETSDIDGGGQVHKGPFDVYVERPAIQERKAVHHQRVGEMSSLW